MGTLRNEMLYRVAAQNGDTGAAVELGKLVFKRDPGEALRLWAQAVQQGDLRGAWWTGLACEFAGDIEGAADWYQMAFRSKDQQTRAWADQALARVNQKRQRATTAAPGASRSAFDQSRPHTFDDPDRIAAPVDPPNVPPAAIRQTRVPTVPSPQSVLLEGIAAGTNLGGYDFSYAMGQLMVSVPDATPRIGGYYMVGSLPVGEWIALMERQGFVLPVAIQKQREHAYYVRVDPAPLKVRTIASIPG